MHKDPEYQDIIQDNTDDCTINQAREFYENGEYENAVACADGALNINANNIDLLVIKGQSLRFMGMFEEALECAEKAIELDSELKEPVYLKLETLFNLQDYQTIIETTERILSQYPDDLYTNWLYVYALIRIDQHQQALEHIDFVLAEVSKDIRFLMLKAELLEDVWHDHYEAVECYNNILDLDSDHLDAWKEKLRLLMVLGEDEEAEQAFSQAYEHFSSRAKTPDNLEALYALGSLCETLSKFKESIFWYEQVVRLEPDAMEVWKSLAFCYYQEQDIENAIRCNDAVLAVEDDAYMLFDKAHSLLRLYRSEEAVPCIEKSLKLDPWNMQAWADLSKALLFLGQDDKRRTLLKEGVQLFNEVLQKSDDNTGHCYYAQGYLQRLLGNYQEAADILTKALPLLPDNARFYDQMGIVLGNLGREEDALEYHLKAVELDPLDPEYLNNIGASLVMLKRYEEAREYLYRAEKSSPNYANVQHNLGTCSLSLGDTEKAIEHYEKAIAMDAGDWKPHYKLGEIYDEKEQLEKAVRHFEMSEKINNAEGTIPLRTAYCYAELGEFIKAKDCIERGRALIPEHDPYYYNTVAFVAEKESDIETAIKYFEKAIKHGSTTEYYMNSLGKLYIQKNEYKKALKAFDLAIQRDPHYVDAHMNKVQIYLDKEQPKKALDVCSRAIEMEPENSLVSYWMGRVYLNIKDFNQSYFYFKRAEEIRPGDVSTRVNMAISLFYLEEYLESLALLESIIKDHPEEYLCYLYKGYILAIDEKYSEALENLLKAKELNPHDKDIDDFMQLCRDAL